IPSRFLICFLYRLRLFSIAPPSSEIYSLSLHDALPISMEFQFGMNWSYYSSFVGDTFGTLLAVEGLMAFFMESTFVGLKIFGWRSEEHTSELQSRFDLVCRLLLEKKKRMTITLESEVTL